MNCKPGDLAIYVGHARSLRGMLFRVVRLLPTGEYWEVDPPPPPSSEYLAIGVINDRSLRPIRPGDISDEEVRELYAPKVPEAA